MRIECNSGFNLNRLFLEIQPVTALLPSWMLGLCHFLYLDPEVLAKLLLCMSLTGLNFSSDEIVMQNRLTSS